MLGSTSQNLSCVGMRDWSRVGGFSRFASGTNMDSQGEPPSGEATLSAEAVLVLGAEYFRGARLSNDSWNTCEDFGLIIETSASEATAGRWRRTMQREHFHCTRDVAMGTACSGLGRRIPAARGGRCRAALRSAIDMAPRGLACSSPRNGRDAGHITAAAHPARAMFWTRVARRDFACNGR